VLVGLGAFFIGFWPITVLAVLVVVISLIAQAFTPPGIRWR